MNSGKNAEDGRVWIGFGWLRLGTCNGYVWVLGNEQSVLLKLANLLAI